LVALALPLLWLLPVAVPPPTRPHQPLVKPETRTYYIAADTASWNYVPGGRDGILAVPYADTAFFAGGPPRPFSTT
jgi:hypothetical protein